MIKLIVNRRKIRAYYRRYVLLTPGLAKKSRPPFIVVPA